VSIKDGGLSPEGGCIIIFLLTERGMYWSESELQPLLRILSQPTLDAAQFDPICHICYELGIASLVSVG
jgi:hypothetical protein